MEEEPPSITTTTTRPLLLHERWCHHLCLKTTLCAELSGAVGDLGTYIPIILALTLVSHLDLSTTFIFTALYNFATGLLFGIPMPVQPTKSIAAVAIFESPHLSVPQIAAAGLSTAGILLILGVSGLMSFLYRFIPCPVVRGVQLSHGLSFAFTAVKYIRFNQDLAASKSTSPRPWLGLDGLLLALTSLLFLILATRAGENNQSHNSNTINHNRSPRVKRRWKILSQIPAALIVFLFGLILCFFRDISILGDLKFGPSKITVLKIAWEDWKIGFLRGAIPQIPFSILNSVITVCKLSGDLFPEHEASARTVSISVGVMNFVGCWFGAMPVCHGAEGLAEQYRFGGRSGALVVFLGIGKLALALALAFGNSFASVLNEFSIGILGVLLFFTGIELAMASKDMNSKEVSFVMLVCAAVSLTGSSSALGFGCGILLFLLLKLREVEFGRVGFLEPKLESSKIEDEDETSSFIACGFRVEAI